MRALVALGGNFHILLKDRDEMRVVTKSAKVARFGYRMRFQKGDRLQNTVLIQILTNGDSQLLFEDS